MNRRDALKSFSALAVGAAFPAVTAFSHQPEANCARIRTRICHWSEFECIMLHNFKTGEKEVVSWQTPKWQCRYWTPEFAAQVDREKREIDYRNEFDPEYVVLRFS